MNTEHMTTQCKFYAGFRGENHPVVFSTRLDVNANEEYITSETGATWCFGPATMQKCIDYAQSVTNKAPHHMRLVV